MTDRPRAAPAADLARHAWPHGSLAGGVVGSPATCPNGLAIRLAEIGGRRSGIASRPASATSPGRTCARVVRLAGRRAGRRSARPGRRPTTRRPSSGSSASAFRHDARYYLETMRAPRWAGDLRPRADRRSRTPAVVDAAFAETAPVIFVGLHFGSIELPGFYLRRALRPAGHDADGDDRRPGHPGLVRTYPGRGRDPARRAWQGRAAASCAAALERGEPVGPGRRPGHHRRRHRRSRSSAPGAAPRRARRSSPSRPARADLRRRRRRTAPGRYRGPRSRSRRPGRGTRREQVDGLPGGRGRAPSSGSSPTAPDQWWARLLPDLAGPEARA